MTTHTPTRLDAIRALLERRQRDGTTHWDGCEAHHIDCATWRLLEVAGAAERVMVEGMSWGSLQHLQLVLADLEKEVPS